MCRILTSAQCASRHVAHGSTGVEVRRPSFAARSYGHTVFAVARPDVLA